MMSSGRTATVLAAIASVLLIAGPLAAQQAPRPTREPFTAERFSAQEALRIGFVQQVVAPDALEATVAAIVKSLVSNSPNAVRQAKRLVREVGGMPITSALIAGTVEGIAQIRASAEGREGVSAFLEKRKPDWLL